MIYRLTKTLIKGSFHLFQVSSILSMLGVWEDQWLRLLKGWLSMTLHRVNLIMALYLLKRLRKIPTTNF